MAIGALGIFGSRSRVRSDRAGAPSVYLDGIVEANHARRPNADMDHVLIVAEDDGCIYGLNLLTQTYGRWDTVARDQEEEYPNFDAMLDDAMRTALEGLPLEITRALDFVARP